MPGVKVIDLRKELTIICTMTCCCREPEGLVPGVRVGDLRKEFTNIPSLAVVGSRRVWWLV